MSGPIRIESPAIARLLVFGSVALMGGMLALAQVAAPPPAPNNAQRQPQAAPQNRTGQRPNADQPQRREAQPARQDERRQDEQSRRNAQPPAERSERTADRGQPREARDDRRGDAGQRSQRQGLGVQFDQRAQGGLTISNIEQESAAAEAGLRAGDRIVSVDGRQITGPRQFQAYISGQLGREIPVVVTRDGQQQTVYLTSTGQGDKAAWLGVFLNDNQDDQRGAMVMQVYPAGPAARAGLRPRDVITHFNGQEVAGSADLIAAVEEQEAGSKAELTVLRGNQEAKLTTVLGNRDQFIFRGQGDERSFVGRQGGPSDRGGGFGQDDEFSNLPPYAMQLEHDRRMAEQHERLENQMIKLQDEVRQLRELIQQQQRR
jgi:C-terminal processing protease CtpA/Prc